MTSFALPPTLADSSVVKLRTHALIVKLKADGVLGSDSMYPQGWIAQKTSDKPETLFKVEGSGKVGVLVSTRTPWTIPNAHNTLRFPRIMVEIIADSSRDSMGNLSRPDAANRCEYAFSQIDKVLHNPENNDHLWPLGLYVISSLRGQELYITEYAGGDSAVIGTVFYNVELG